MPHPFATHAPSEPSRPEPGRLAALRETLARLELDALMIVEPENLRYLSGFTGSRGVLLVHRDAPAELVVDGRYALQAGQEAPGVRVRAFPGRDDARTVARCLARAGAVTVAYEAGATTVESYFRYADALADFSLVPARALVEEAREIKDAQELARLAAAGETTAAAFEAAVAALRTGVTERAIAEVLLAAMRERGAEGPAFAPLVAFGERSALPHPVPTERRLAPGDWVLIDAGAKVAGYRADCSRTFVYGEPTDAQRALWEAVAEAQDAAVAALRPGVPARRVAAVARAALRARGFKGPLAHPLGHGLGLGLHEAPFLAPDAPERLEAGMVLAVEPGLYRPGFGGVRLEDTLALTPAGARGLTPAPRRLAVAAVPA